MTATTARSWLDDLNRTYERLHTAKEDAFWRAKMGLGNDPAGAQDEADRLEIELQRLLQDPRQLARATELLAELGDEIGPEDELRVGLEGWRETFACHTIDSAEARDLAEEIVSREGALEQARGAMELGYVEQGQLVRASSVKLGGMLRTEPLPERRRAAWEGLRSIETHVLENGFLELVAERNRLGRMLGAEDYYDWKTRRVERMTKAEVFALLDELELRTRDRAREAVEELRARDGDEAVQPWNIVFAISGDTTREQDPYFPFRDALSRWGRSFAALGIDYRGAELVLDLVDRPGKYENGFMHGPVVAWRANGEHRPARIHFTANAIPGMVGSGRRATETLFHEGGHAAHFANIDMPAPCFGQEFAPTSVGFSETQSMFLDSLLGDADWQRRYACTVEGEPIPMELIERGLRDTQPFAAWSARAMLAVCYGERVLYEIPDRERTAERVLGELREVERRLLFIEQGGTRPVLSVPHLLAGDSSAYYHGYVLADMAVHQTRNHFIERDGCLVDNPNIGPDLRRAYWEPGNSRGFDRMVRDLTGRSLSADAYARHLNRTADEAVEDARRAVARLEQVPRHTAPVELSARVRVVHGGETIAEFDGGDFAAFAETFARWIDDQVGA